MVHIKKVTTKGFKSYGNRTVSVTLSRNFTSIVGPNGSGKSNIIDAISFVLGKLSTKSLRAEVLTDLIFTGSKTMNPATYAEVSLYLDNSDNGLPFERKEVIISRSVDTTGKSVYRLNRKRETRTYVLDILSQVGIFPEGHNLIMQGDITRFIKMSSWERRGVIEEISGIAEYAERKERGDRELEKANENIARAELVLNEVKKQLDRLENEKNDALRYQFLKEEIFRCKGWLYSGELRRTEQRLREVMGDTEKNKKEIGETEKRISDIVMDIAEKEENFEIVSSEIEKLGEEKHGSITREIERLRGELRSAEQGLQYLKERETQLRGEKKREEQELHETRMQILKDEGRKEELEKKREELDKRISDLKEEYQTYLSVLSEAGLEKLETIIKELDEKKNAFFSLETRAGILENDVANLEGAKGEVEPELEGLRSQKHAAEKEGKDVEDTLQEVEHKVGELTSRYTTLEEERKALKREIAQIDSDFLQKRTESIRLHSKLQAFKEEQRTSPNKAVDTILKAKDKIKGIYGTISQLGGTEARYQIALEVAAGSRLQNIVVDTKETARKCIQYLKEQRAGRATFLPLDRMEGIRLPPITEKGVIDYAVNLVKADSQFRAAFEYVFSDTLVVEDLDTDLKGARLVTLEGDVSERGGAITGGYYFKRKFSSAFLISEDESQFRRVQEELHLLKARREEVQLRLGEVEGEARVAYDEKLRLEERIPSLRRERERFRREETEIGMDIQEKEKKLLSLTEELGKKEEELKTTGEEREKMAREIESLEREKEEISRPLEKEELERCEKELEVARDELTDVDRERVQLQSELQYLRGNAEKMEKSIAEAIPRIEEVGKEVEEKNAEKKAIEGRLQEKVEEERTFDEKIRGLREERDKTRESVTRLRQEKEALQKRMYQCESAVTFLENQRVQLETEVKDFKELSAQFPAAGEPKEMDLKELKFRIKQMEQEKEGLEPINQRAVEEFDEVQLRFIELKTRIDKLYEERQSILDFIAEVESQKKTVFLETYYKVAENFSRIFAELSPGGSGTLLLENVEDPLAGGLDVEASPGGKELKRVEAMSGGEKALTALAFVFAVQQYKPAPFYVFDEIDAHLDDENVTRVADLIKRASRETQFVVITLRDAMMAAADILYGVSMKEGISKIVSVELERIAEYKEPRGQEVMVKA